MKSAVPSSIAAQISHARAVLHKHLPGSIVAVHLFGSAVDAGLKPLSDIDLLVTVEQPPSAAVRHTLMQELLAVSAPPGASASLRALEVTLLARGQIVPWRYPPRREMQFGEWLREDLQAGVFEEPTADPDLAILLTKARNHSICLEGAEATDLFDPVPHTDVLQALRDMVAQWNEPADWAGEERHIVLALARGWYTASTGGIASKEAAAAWLLELPLGDTHRQVLHQVLKTARAAYLGLAQDDLARHPEDVAAFIAHARHAIERLCAGRPGEHQA